jgi:hypothetical protein
VTHLRLSQLMVFALILADGLTWTLGVIASIH